MKFIEPPLKNKASSSQEEDLNGLWPLYIYNYGLSCQDIFYDLFIHTVNDKSGVNSSLYTANSTCKNNTFYNSTHHFFDEKTKNKIYTIYNNESFLLKEDKKELRIGIKLRYADGV